MSAASSKLSSGASGLSGDGIDTAAGTTALCIIGESL
jgi:hypothetical protein